jgi:hypothetical protein
MNMNPVLFHNAEEEEEEQNESLLPPAPVVEAAIDPTESQLNAAASATGVTVGDEGIIEGAVIGENYEGITKAESSDEVCIIYLFFPPSLVLIFLFISGRWCCHSCRENKHSKENSNEKYKNIFFPFPS